MKYSIYIKFYPFYKHKNYVYFRWIYVNFVKLKSITGTVRFLNKKYIHKFLYSCIYIIDYSIYTFWCTICLKISKNMVFLIFSSILNIVVLLIIYNIIHQNALISSKIRFIKNYIDFNFIITWIVLKHLIFICFYIISNKINNDIFN